MKRIFILFLLVIAGCARKRPENLTTLKNQIECYYESCEYEKEVGCVVNKALKYFKTHKFPAGSVVVFDVDDTLLSDYCEIKKLYFGFVPELNHEWVLHVNAHAVPHMKKLYDYLQAQGYAIVILSGRKENERAATIKNLHERGFTGFKQMILREQDEEKLTALAFKSARRKKLVQAGARIVGCIGDQWSDLEGGNTGHRVKIPNYTYIIE